MTTRVGFVACRLGELVHRGCVGILDRQRQERRAVTTGERLFEARDQLLDCVGRRRRLTAGRVREREARQRQEKAKGHGWSHIRPLGAVGESRDEFRDRNRGRGRRVGKLVRAASYAALIR